MREHCERVWKLWGSYHACWALGSVCCRLIFSRLPPKEASPSYGPYIVFALTDTMDAYDSGRLKQLLKDAGVTIA